MINLLISKYTGKKEDLPLPKRFELRVIIVGLNEMKEFFEVMEFYKERYAAILIEVAKDHVIITDIGSHIEVNFTESTTEESVKFYTNI